VGAAGGVRSLEPHDTNHENFLVLGPWRHGSWILVAASRRAQYGESIGKEYRAQIEAKFFAKYLKDEPGFDLEDTASFQTGSNTWKRYAHFPPAEAKSTAFSLCGSGTIAQARLPRWPAELCLRSGQPRSLSSSPHPAHLWRRLQVGHMDGRRPALCHRSQRRRRMALARPDQDLTSPAK
jgi:hypothetical protein